jgi:hypothetical protein
MWLIEGTQAHVFLLQAVLHRVPNVRELFREELRVRLLAKEESLDNLEALTDQYLAEYLPPLKRLTVKERVLRGLHAVPSPGAPMWRALQGVTDPEAPVWREDFVLGPALLPVAGDNRPVDLHAAAYEQIRDEHRQIEHNSFRMEWAPVRPGTLDGLIVKDGQQHTLTDCEPVYELGEGALPSGDVLIDGQRHGIIDYAEGVVTLAAAAGAWGGAWCRLNYCFSSDPDARTNRDIMLSLVYGNLVENARRLPE